MRIILTDIGEQLASEGFLTGNFPKITKVWFGDGNGTILIPNKNMTSLVNMIYEGVGTVIARFNTPNRLYIYTQLPIMVGDVTIREVGLLTENNVLIAIGGEFEKYKPPVSESVEKMDFYITLPISSTQEITVEFSNDNLYASQDAIDIIANAEEANRLELVAVNNILPTKVDYTDVINALTSIVTNKPLSAAQGKVLKGLVDTKQAIIEDNTLAITKLDINAGTDIGSALTDTDTIIIDDGGANIIKKSSISRIWTYISGKLIGAVSTITTANLTANRAVISDANGKVAVSTVTNNELTYLGGATSNIQDQLDTKVATGRTINGVNFNGDSNISVGLDTQAGSFLTSFKLNTIHKNKLLVCDNGITITLPNINTIKSGDLFYICNDGLTPLTIALNGNSTNLNTQKITGGETLVIQSDGGSHYRCISRGATPVYDFDTNLITSLDYNTVFRADEDLTLVVLCTGNYMNGVEIVTGTTTSPTRVVSRMGDDINSNTKWVTLTAIIPAGLYFKVRGFGGHAFEEIEIIGYKHR